MKSLYPLCGAYLSQFRDLAVALAIVPSPLVHGDEVGEALGRDFKNGFVRVWGEALPGSAAVVGDEAGLTGIESCNQALIVLQGDQKAFAVVVDERVVTVACVCRDDACACLCEADEARVLVGAIP